MNRHLALALLMFALFLNAPLRSQTTKAPEADVSSSGNRYLEICASEEKPTERWNEMDFLHAGLCEGFMLGVRDGMGFTIAALKHDNSSLSYLKGSIEDLGVCEPDTVELGQIVRVVLKYIRDHPEQAHRPSAELVVMAELNAFPCALAPTRAPKPKQ